MKAQKPKFLSTSLAVGVIVRVFDLVKELCPNLKKHHFHVVVVIPEISISLGEFIGRASCEIKPNMLASVSFGDEGVKNNSGWKHHYDKIAISKAEQIWVDLNLKGDEADPPAHLLTSGATLCGGGVKMEGIVVACSGLQPWFDTMISRMVASALIALAREDYENSEEKVRGFDFLS